MTAEGQQAGTERNPALPVLNLPPGAGPGWITATVTDPILKRRAGTGWWIAFAVGLSGTGLMVVSIVWLFVKGTGIWGINTSNVWGFAIANYVWWIGIGNAGTLISCLLLLTRQNWRAAINRFAEAMTLFAAAIAGLFPILHLGRPELFYWLVPYPNVMGVWPQWRSPLVWDFFAITSYLIFSLLFWYTGLIPDLAAMRDRTRTRLGQVLYGTFALGWRGAASHWHHYERFYKVMAALGVPLVVSLHSVVGLDFAVGIAPGWHETIFPPYFVVGAMYSGFAMVLTLAVVVRHVLGLHALVTLRHFEAMARILLLGGLIMGLAYATEWFMAWYSGDGAEWSLAARHFTGPYAPYYWLMLLCNVGAVQALWLPAARRNMALLFAISIIVNIGMWLERILIVIETPSHSFLPSQWRLFAPTFWDWALLAGTVGFFFWLFVCLLRVVPAVSIHETRRLYVARHAGHGEAAR